VSFYRSFSYRQEYIYPDQLADQLRDPQQRVPLLKTNWNQGVFGIRFKSVTDATFVSTFIPLRKVEIARVDASDQINLHFKLGHFIKPTIGTRTLPTLLPKMDLTGVVPQIQETKLFIGLRDADAAAMSAWTFTDEFPAGMWEALENSISPTARGKISNTVLLRLVRIRQRGKPANLDAEKLDAQNNLWGFRLRENRAYDFTLDYFRLKDPATPSPPVEHQYVMTNPPEEIQTSKRSIQFNANYRNEEMWIAPKTAGAGPIQIAFEPCKLGDNKVVDSKAAKTIGLKIPVTVAKERWPRSRWVNLLIGLVSAILIVILVRKAIWAPESTQKVLLLIIAGVVSLAVNAFKDVVLPK
jgi:hypothetical protein